jgi:hypothetical protein
MKSKSKFGWIRGGTATVFTLLYVAILIPNLVSFNELVLSIGFLLVPLSCIHFGANRFMWLEVIGWVIFAGLFMLILG